MRPLAARRAVASWILFGSLIGVSSCTRTPMPSIEIAPDMTYSGDWSTPLPDGVSSDPVVFRTEAMRFDGAGPVLERARAGANCHGCAVTVRVRTIGDTRSTDPARPPRPGRPFAQITNLDPTNVEAYYGFKPQSQADYYLWIDSRPDAADSARITVVEVPRAVGRVRAGRQKKLELCHVESHGSTPLRGVDFVEYRHPGGCDYLALRGDRKEGVASLLSATGFFKFLGRSAATFGVNLPIFSREAWIDCNSGCCT